MRLIKHFDFEHAKQLDPSEWNVEVGEKWANHEKQHYVNKKENLYFDKGLVICATHKDGVYESVRLNTKDKFCFQYGKIEMIAKVPSGRGTWPALWMMSQDLPYGTWPRSGEIDIMEHTGNEKDKLYLCIHTEAYNHTRKEQYFSTYTESGVADAFHKYGLVWEPESITYYFNDKLVTRYDKGADGKDSSPKGWPFDHPFYLLVNMAIGGSLGGDVVAEDFPQKFVIKSIKVYQ